MNVASMVALHTILIHDMIIFLR